MIIASSKFLFRYDSNQLLCIWYDLVPFVILIEPITCTLQLTAITDSEHELKQRESKFEQEIQELQNEIDDKMKKYEDEIQQLKLSKESLQLDCDNLSNQLSAVRNEASIHQETITKVTGELKSTNAELENVRCDLESKTTECKRKDHLISKKEEEILSYISTLEERDAKIRKGQIEKVSLTNELTNVQSQLDAEIAKCRQLNQVIGKKEEEILDFKATIQEKDGIIQDRQLKIESLSSELNTVSTQLHDKIAECQQLNEIIKELEEDIKNHLLTLEDKDAEIRNGEAERRKLHNCVQELKGNIRVFCRVRPILNSSGTIACPPHISFAEGSDTNIKLTPCNQSEVVVL